MQWVKKVLFQAPVITRACGAQPLMRQKVTPKEAPQSTRFTLYSSLPLHRPPFHPNNDSMSDRMELFFQRLSIATLVSVSIPCSHSSHPRHNRNRDRSSVLSHLQRSFEGTCCIWGTSLISQKNKSEVDENRDQRRNGEALEK